MNCSWYCSLKMAPSLNPSSRTLLILIPSCCSRPESSVQFICSYCVSAPMVATERNDEIIALPLQCNHDGDEELLNQDEATARPGGEADWAETGPGALLCNTIAGTKEETETSAICECKRMVRIVPVKFLAIYISAAIKWRGKSEKEGDWNCIGCRGMTSKWRKREGRWLICSFRLKNKWRIRVEGIEWDFWRHFITSVPFSSSIQLKDYDEQLFAFYLIVSGKTTDIQYGNWKEKWVEVEDSLF